ncbi:uncharacterized protein LOC125384447 [Haliotis rufescens]|uniref:uncharacterized protein LOC125384447 n=1 Tax=Haliotis rufescens TaxID=6454 RepID=UPI00201EB575|nr:uncharacterized protein LOC125384447 [Haliotis rufescens]
MFANVASAFHQARDELNRMQRHSLALSHPDTPVPLPDPTHRFNSHPLAAPPVTLTPVSDPSLQSSAVSLVSTECVAIDLGDPVHSLGLPSVSKPVEIPSPCQDIDLGDPTTSQYPYIPVESPLPCIVIDISDIELEDTQQTQSFVGSCFYSVLNFVKELFSFF